MTRSARARRRRRHHRAGRRRARWSTTAALDVELCGGRRSARRQDPHVAVRRAGARRRGRRRVPRPRARTPSRWPARSGSATTLTSPTDATATVWHDGLHPIPGGLVLGVPASVRPFVTTSLLSAGAASCGPPPSRCCRAPIPTTRSARSSAPASATRSTSASSTPSSAASTPPTPTTSSLAAVPQLAAAGGRAHRSLLLGGAAARGAQAPASAAGPIFDAPRAGMGALVDAAEPLRRRSRRTRASPARPATAIERDGARLARSTASASTPSCSPRRRGAPAPLLGAVAPDAGRLLAAFEHADVIMVRLAIAADDCARRPHGRSGYLVPKRVSGYVTAVSFGSQKWAHWRPDDGSQILRVSLGRDGLPRRRTSTTTP